MLASFQQYDDLVHQIYDAALEPRRWPAVMERLVHACGGFCGALFTPRHTPAQGGVMVPVDLPASMMELWAARFSGPENDPFTRAALARGQFQEGVALIGDELVPQQELRPSRFYRDLWEPAGIGRMCGGVVFDSTDAHKLPTVVVIFARPTDPPFDAVQTELIRRLLAHLSRSLGVMFHLRDSRLREVASHAALDRLACGVVLLDAMGKVCFLNVGAAAQVAAGHLWRLDGDSPAQRQLVLVLRLRRFEPDLRQAIQSALQPLGEGGDDHFSQALVLPDADGKPACVLHAAPLGEGAAPGLFQAGGSTPRAILFLYDLAAAFSVPPGLLVRLFDLTDAEACAALQVLQGGGVKVMARRLGLSPNTVKTQLSAVYDKTQTRRQADLLKLLLALATR